MKDVGLIYRVTAVLALGVLPVFLLGAVAVEVRSDRKFDEAKLGVCAAAFWTSAALTSLASGRGIERLGAVRALAIAAGVSTACLLGLAASSSWGMLAACLGAGGIANSLSQVAANLGIVRGVAHRHRGLAFGILQSSVPATTLVGGIAVPAIALSIGWRWVFLGGAASAAVVAFLVVRGALPDAQRGVRRDATLGGAHSRGRTISQPVSRPLLFLGIAALFGAAGTGAMATFIVEYATSAGSSAGHAGGVLAAGSAAAIIARLLSGHLADRYQVDSLHAVAAMLISGAALTASLPILPSSQLGVCVIVLACATGWGWPGMFQLSIVNANPSAPAAASGVTQTGTAIGGAGGPLGFGIIVARNTYAAAWWLVAACLLLAGLFILIGRHLVNQQPPA